MSRAALAQAVNDWRLSPQPERFTELYFADYRQLPTVLKPGASQKLSFTVNNVEQRTVMYHYAIIAKSSSSSAEQLLSEDRFVLAQGHAQSINRTLTPPKLDQRMAIKVVLDYTSQTPGNTSPSLQAQSIQYWFTVASPKPSEKSKS